MTAISGVESDVRRALAPWPQTDRYPIVIGQSLTLQYLASVFRIATIGYRQQYVDLLDELLEKDPHAYSVLAKRVETIACAKIEIVAPEIKDEKDRARAEELAAFARENILAIPSLRQHMASLMWGEFYGLAALETMWSPDGNGWKIDELQFVHSRRLSYPDAEWRVHIWDQGLVAPQFGFGKFPSERIFGLRLDDYPGKFVVHAPQLRGDYPTREGFGRQIATWIVLKLIASRGAGQYLERFAKPIPDATYSTKEQANDFKGRAAKDREIQDAEAAMRTVGVGSLSYYLHSDAIQWALKTPDAGTSGPGKLTFAEWIAICDSQMSKAILSATLTTEVGVGGSRALGDTQKEGEDKRFVYSAELLGGTMKRDLVTPLVRLNHGDVPARLMPNVIIRTGEDPDPMTVLDKAVKAASAGAPVDADATCEEVGVTLIKNETGKPRRLWPLAGAKMVPPPEVIGLPKVEPEDAATNASNDNAPPSVEDEEDDDEEPLPEAAE